MFIPSWGRFPVWLIFFKGVEAVHRIVEMEPGSCSGCGRGIENRSNDTWMTWRTVGTTEIRNCVPSTFGTKAWDLVFFWKDASENVDPHLPYIFGTRGLVTWYIGLPGSNSGSKYIGTGRSGYMYKLLVFLVAISWSVWCPKDVQKDPHMSSDQDPGYLLYIWDHTHADIWGL